jgi:hypothetical protein
MQITTIDTKKTNEMDLWYFSIIVIYRYIKKFLSSADWLSLRAVQFFRNTVLCQKMKYSANFIDYEIQPFPAENNTKNPNIYK